MRNDILEIFDEIEELLERERKHVLRGDLSKFAELLNEKEELLQRLSGVQSEESPRVQMMQSRMQYNQSLLEAAMRGIKSASERLQDIRSVRDGVETYDNRGKRKHLPNTGARRFERRA